MTARLREVLAPLEESPEDILRSLQVINGMILDEQGMARVAGAGALEPTAPGISGRRRPTIPVIRAWSRLDRPRPT